MRIFEFIFLISQTTLFISLCTKYSLIKKWTFYGCVVFLILHLFIEQGRWQLYLGYVAILAGMLLYYKSAIKKWAKITLSVIGILFCAISVALGSIMPVIEFPEPSGPYSVGSQSLYLEDTSRPEILTKEEGDKRKLTIHIWYPSYQKITNPERYMDDGYAEAFLESKSMPSLIASHFDITKTHTQKLLPITKDQLLPVIILSHGLLWNSKMYTVIVEEIVSNGYLVVGIDHIYESFLTEYNGEKIHWNRENINSMNNGLDFGLVNKKMDTALYAKDSEDRNKAAKELIRYLPYFESFDRWSDDISFIIDQLILLNNQPKSFLYQKLNVNQIGSLGHSWGGAAVVQNTSVDHRVKAVINMDGAQWGRVIDTTLQKPLMVMHADRNYNEFFTPNFYVYDQIAQNDYYLATIHSTGHANFGDLSYWTKIHSLTETGSIDPERMSTITNDLILKFFKKYLKGQKVDMEAVFSNENYPEVLIQMKKKSIKK